MSHVKQEDIKQEIEENCPLQDAENRVEVLYLKPEFIKEEIEVNDHHQNSENCTEIFHVKQEEINNIDLHKDDKSPDEFSISCKQENQKHLVVTEDTLIKNKNEETITNCESSLTKQNDIKYFKCDHCDYKSVWKNHVKIHKLTHVNIRPHQCNQCPYKSNWKSNLKIHQLTHIKKQAFKCDKCQFSCKKKSDFESHKLKHNNNKTKLPFGYKQKSDLVKLTDTNLEKQVLKCDRCEFSSKRKSYFLSHKLKHDNVRPFRYDKMIEYICINNTDSVRKTLSRNSVRTFKCNECDYSCVEKDSFIRHKITHTDVRPFKCDRCEYSCARENNLVRHKLKHTNVGSFKCNECEFSCIEKDSFIRHKLAHV